MIFILRGIFLFLLILPLAHGYTIKNNTSETLIVMDSNKHKLSFFENPFQQILEPGASASCNPKAKDCYGRIVFTVARQSSLYCICLQPKMDCICEKIKTDDKLCELSTYIPPNEPGHIFIIKNNRRNTGDLSNNNEECKIVEQ